jgi:hypothetical protein
MKRLLPRFALVLAAAASTSAAWAITSKTCGEFTYPAFNATFSGDTRRCPASSGVVQSIASLTRMTTANEATRFAYTYSVEMITGPGPLSQPRVGVLLLKSTGTPVISAAGTQCPEAVDINNIGGPGNVQTCRIAKLASAAMSRVRIIHQTL